MLCADIDSWHIEEIDLMVNKVIVIIIVPKIAGSFVLITINKVALNPDN